MPSSYYRKGRRYRRGRGANKNRSEIHGNMSDASKVIIQQPSAMPDVTFVKLKFFLQLFFSDNEEQEIGIKMNDIYDPWPVGTDHALGFNEWMEFYDSFEVFGSGIVCKLINQSIDVQAEVCLYPGLPSSPLSLYEAVQQPYAKWGLINLATGGNALLNLNHFMNVRKFTGRQTQDMQYTGTGTTSPTQICYWYIVVSSVDNLSNISVKGEFEVIYYCKLFNRTALLQS